MTNTANARSTVEDVEAVTFEEHRWYLRIRLAMRDGSMREFVASADAGFTYGDGIWFGPQAEYYEAVEEQNLSRLTQAKANLDDALRSNK